MPGKPSRAAWAVANGLMCLAFLFSVVVQLNDPDPLRWMGVYGAAVVACGLELAGRGRRIFPLLVGAIALVWAASIAPRVIGAVPFVDMFAEFEMKNAGVEESREMYGLLIVALWMGVLAWAAQRRAGAPGGPARS